MVNKYFLHSALHCLTRGLLVMTVVILGVCRVPLPFEEAISLEAVEPRRVIKREVELSKASAGSDAMAEIRR